MVNNIHVFRKLRQSACKPGSVWRGSFNPRVTAIPLGRSLPTASSNQPGRRPGDGPGANQFPGGLVSSLFGFAPGGACRAARVTASAVRSYRTLSPLPIAGWAVYFLWRFPWGRPRRTLSGTVSPWSPDFPLPWCPTEAAVQPTGEPHIGAGGTPGQSFKSQNARRRNPFGFRPLARPRARGGFACGKPRPALANGLN